jgi:predicted metalloprotease
LGVFVSKVLATTEDVWRSKFREAGQQYEDPKLVLFTGLTRTACGNGMATMGPFYCPLDRKIYLDLSFFRELKLQYRAPGTFAQAYVIAHEVGHHVQTLLGVESRVSALQSKMSEQEANRLNIRLELQADCLAGIWASSLPSLPGVSLEPDDIQQGLRATEALGDDIVQKRTVGTIVLDSFTHGSGDQRARWFKRGLDSGKLDQCNTFAASDL